MSRKTLNNIVTYEKLKDFSDERLIEDVTEYVGDFFEEYPCFKRWSAGDVKSVALDFLGKLSGRKLDYDVDWLFIVFLWDSFLRKHIDEIGSCEKELLLFSDYFKKTKKVRRYVHSICESFREEPEDVEQLVYQIILEKIAKMKKTGKFLNFPQMIISICNALVDRKRKLSLRINPAIVNFLSSELEKEDAVYNIRSHNLYDNPEKRTIIEDKLTDLQQGLSFEEQKLLCSLLGHDCRFSGKDGEPLSRDALYQRKKRFKEKKLRKFFLKWKEQGFSIEDMAEILALFSHACLKICQKQD